MELRPRHLIGELDSRLDVRLAGAPQSGLQEFGQGVVQVLQRPQLVLQEAPLAIGRLAILDGRYQLRPAVVAVFAGNDVLRFLKGEFRLDLLLRGVDETGMVLPDARQDVGCGGIGL